MPFIISKKSTRHGKLRNLYYLVENYRNAEHKIKREHFLNFSVDEQKVLSYLLKPPFDEMLKMHQQRNGRTGATSIELFAPLADPILTYWNPATFDKSILNLDIECQDVQVGYQF